jgi:hypothetical protein
MPTVEETQKLCRHWKHCAEGTKYTMPRHRSIYTVPCSN